MSVIFSFQKPQTQDRKGAGCRLRSQILQPVEQE